MAVDNIARGIAGTALGKTAQIQAEVDGLKTLGRFLTYWDCTTGLPTTNPPALPYTYETGDYYRISKVAAEGGTNYKPNGAQYDGTASTTVDTETVGIGKIYYYDGYIWSFQNSLNSVSAFDVEVADLQEYFDSGNVEGVLEEVGRKLDEKQDTITDLATIRSGAEAGATAVQPESGKGLFSGNYNDLTNKPTIPAAVTESTVAGWGFTKNTGTYSKPSTGIPASDLASGVIPTELSQLSGDSTHRTVTDADKTTWNNKQDAIGYTPENVANKVTSISSSSTDTQYPSAKAVYSFIQSLDGNGVSY